MPNLHPDCFAGHGRSSYAYIWTRLSSVTFSVSSQPGPVPEQCRQPQRQADGAHVVERQPSLVSICRQAEALIISISFTFKENV